MFHLSPYTSFRTVVEVAQVLELVDPAGVGAGAELDQDLGPAADLLDPLLVFGPR